MDNYELNQLMGGLFGLLVGGVFISIVLYIVCATIKAKNSKQPIESKWAKVVEKQVGNAKDSIVPGNETISVCFEFENGSRKVMHISASQGLLVGDTGLLTWQGTVFISFKRDATFNGSQSTQNKGSSNGEYVPAWKRVEEAETDQSNVSQEHSKKCIFCGEPIPKGHVYCGACGRSVH